MQPTFLYIKRHKITGLKYFGKTIKNPIKYNGSGQYWLKHLKKHGAEHIETLWTKQFTNEQQIKRFCSLFCKLVNITHNEQWANLVPENGTDGGCRSNSMVGKSFFIEFNKKPKSNEIKNKISSSTKGIPKPKKTPENNIKTANTLKGKHCKFGFKCSVYEKEYSSIKEACESLQITRFQFSQLEKQNLANRL
jgi:hypothetical protein